MPQRLEAGQAQWFPPHWVLQPRPYTATRSNQCRFTDSAHEDIATSLPPKIVILLMSATFICFVASVCKETACLPLRSIATTPSDMEKRLDADW